MVKSLHSSLEAKLASIKDPEYDDSDVDGESEDDQPETISAKRAGKGSKRKSRKKDATAQSTDDDASNQPSTVIYLGHLPVGFEEREITAFFNQFGNVNRCRVSRSTKTGRSRGYAFVDFADTEVAKIVAETMSGYFLLEKRLVCHVLPNDKVHELMFVRPKRVPTKAEKQKKARAEVNKRRSADVMKEITVKLVKREEMKRKKLAALGIDYDFPGYNASAKSVAESNNSSKKKRKKSDSVEEEVEKGNEPDNVLKASKSQKRKKKSKKGKAEKEDEKENDATNELDEVAEEPSEKKKKSKKSQKKK